MSRTKFLLSKIFFKNLLLGIAILIVLSWIFLIIMDFYTDHGESVVVPDFRGSTKEQLDNIANSHNLKYVIVDSIFDQKHRKGTVVDQYPEPKFKVKEDRIVYLTVNAMTTEKVQMPKLVDLSLRQAVSKIETYGLRLGGISYAPSFAKNAVINQLHRGREIKEGDKIDKGAIIDLVLGQGLSQGNVAIPYLVGMVRDSAIVKIKLATLNLGVELFDETVVTREDSISARVYKQSPKPSSNKFIPSGDYIDIYLTTDTDKIVIEPESVNDSLDEENP